MTVTPSNYCFSGTGQKYPYLLSYLFTINTDQRSVEGQVTCDLKLLAQDLVLDGVDTDVLGLPGGQKVLTVGRVAQRTE